MCRLLNQEAHSGHGRRKCCEKETAGEKAGGAHPEDRVRVRADKRRLPGLQREDQAVDLRERPPFLARRGLLPGHVRRGELGAKVVRLDPRVRRGQVLRRCVREERVRDTTREKYRDLAMVFWMVSLVT